MDATQPTVLLPQVFTAAQAFSFAKTVVAIGNFDGVHLGHRALLEQLLRESADKQATALVFTFSRNPKVLLFGAKALYGEAEKLQKLAELGVPYVLSASYEDLHELTPEAFVREVLIGQLHACGVVVGRDFRFGKGRMGDRDAICRLMQENGGTCTVVPDVELNGQTVSSTAIRALLEKGDVDGATTLLGHPYEVILPICEGKQLGRTLGFPTANQYPPADRLLPKYGVYESVMTVDGVSYRGLTNIGVKPTVSHEARPVFETHLLHFAGDLYGKTAKLALLRFLRKERCFSSIEQLQAQVQADIAQIVDQAESKADLYPTATTAKQSNREAVKPRSGYKK